MAFSKAKNFDENTYLQSIWSKARAHPARIIILTHLLENGTSPFSELKRKIPLASSTVSQHVRTLRLLNLIEPEENHTYAHYKLNRKNCSDLAIRITELENGFIS